MLENIKTKFEYLVVAKMEGETENKIILKLFKKHTMEEITFSLFHVNETNYAYFTVHEKGDFDFSKEGMTWSNIPEGYDVDPFEDDGSKITRIPASEFEKEAVEEIKKILDEWNDRVCKY